jgi:hypothetical membrane protein
MTQETTPNVTNDTSFMLFFGWYALFGCLVFTVAILIADFVVPNHDWIADTISDLGAGKYEFIVDIGIYAFSGSLIAVALLASHVHMGGWRWTAGIIGLAVMALVVFLIGARNEYGDQDDDGTVIHYYLVYALGFLMAAVPLVMASGAGRAGKGYAKTLVAISVIWTLSAPIFFMLPNDIDGIYERYLGMISFAMVATFARLYIRRSHRLRAENSRTS